MPTFYFDLWDGKKIDFADVGLELSGPEAAFEEAIRGARDMLRDASSTTAMPQAGPTKCETKEGRLSSRSRSR
jgi:hypothetical protein